MDILDSSTLALEDSRRSAVKFVAYPKALAMLRKRLGATAEEVAAWVWEGPKPGGLAAYLDANELDPPPRFVFSLGSGNGNDHDYVEPLTACWFRADDIESFRPGHRYITGEALIKRWAPLLDQRTAAFVRAKIRESRLSDLHPLYGLTQGTLPEEGDIPPMTAALFRLSEVEAIVVEDFPDDAEVTSGVAGTVKPDAASGMCDDSTNSDGSGTGRLSPLQSHSDAPLQGQPGGVAPAGTEHLPSPPADGLAVGSPEWRTQNARKAANALHDRPGGAREKTLKIREIYASGIHRSRHECARKECAGLFWSYDAARRALVGTPDPVRSK